MKSRADWGNSQGNSATCFLHFLNAINDLVCHFESHEPPSQRFIRSHAGPNFPPNQRPARRCHR